LNGKNDPLYYSLISCFATNLSGVKIATVRFRPAGKHYLEELPLRWTNTTSSEHLPR